MNSKSTTPLLATQANILATLTAANAPRALIVSLGPLGELVHQPLEHDQSVMRLDELQDHLNARPVSAEYLSDLRDYCDGRLAAQAEARATGGFVIPHSPGNWQIAHVPAFEQVTVGGAQ